jgi:chemotaxis protein MotA
MNLSSIIGLVSGLTVMFFAMKGATSNLQFFLDVHGILIVVGGTAAASSVSFPLKKILALLKVFFLRVLGKSNADFKETISLILEINKRSAQGPQALKDSVTLIKHPFLKEGVDLLVHNVLTEKEIRSTLEQRIRTVEARYLHEANMFRTIGKFPPAFGLLATTLGMIGVLQKIGQENSQALIGPAMSVGLIGTLYGIALTNLIFLPIAENLTERTREEMTLRRMMLEGLLQIKQQTNPVSLRESLNSFVVPGERVNRDSGSTKKAA